MQIGNAIAHIPIGEPVAARTRFDVALSSDSQHLSKFQILMRQQMEFFTSTAADVDYSVQGRKRRPNAGQVGLRCKHCADLDLRQRGRGAVYFPTTINAVYQAAQNMATNHLQGTCSRIPVSVRQSLDAFRDQRETASRGKQYWADACLAVGLRESDDGLCFAPTLAGDHDVNCKSVGAKAEVNAARAESSHSSNSQDATAKSSSVEEEDNAEGDEETAVHPPSN